MHGPVTIIAVGTRGDVQPYIALGKGLRDAGIPVQLATGSGYESLVKQYGLEFRSIFAIDLESHMERDDVKAVLEIKNPVKMLRGLVEITKPYFSEALEGMW
jgi:UDP:flavonoid glycosyltransferase YjiC (YdhE family)